MGPLTVCSLASRVWSTSFTSHARRSAEPISATPWPHQPQALKVNYNGRWANNLRLNNQLTQQPTDTKSSAPLLVGSILGLLLVVAVVGGVIVLRNKEDEEDDWYDEDEEETDAPVVEKPGSESSKSLQELKSEGRSIDDIEVPEERASSLFDEFDTSPVEEIEDYESETFDEGIFFRRGRRRSRRARHQHGRKRY